MSQIPGSWTIIEQDQLISEALERDQPRLRNFIRKHVADTSEAEDILQEVWLRWQTPGRQRGGRWAWAATGRLS